MKLNSTSFKLDLNPLSGNNEYTWKLSEIQHDPKICFRLSWICDEMSEKTYFNLQLTGYSVPVENRHHINHNENQLKCLHIPQGGFNGISWVWFIWYRFLRGFMIPMFTTKSLKKTLITYDSWGQTLECSILCAASDIHHHSYISEIFGRFAIVSLDSAYIRTFQLPTCIVHFWKTSPIWAKRSFLMV